MARGDGKKVVIVKRRRPGAHGHHGGSWKVAYADFVTAMMAFFLVMWIMSMDEGVKDMVQGYFQNPVGFKKAFSGGTNPLAAGNSITNLEVKRTIILNRRAQQGGFERAAAQIERALASDSVMQGLAAEVEVVITEEGLRIELMEAGAGEAFFDRSSAELKPALRHVLAIVGLALRRVPGDVVLEGHTDAVPFGRSGYGNWELSVDRANAARRALETGGRASSRVTQVRGYADRRLKVPEDPLDAHNRRISVLLPFFRADLDSLQARGGTAGRGRVLPEHKGV
ncbi:MAG: hypothetical protein FIA95_09340 [Gemmatimonadetes bacterium]|nr:hypothetical protein [Gemmatimonadota bacterium]